MSPKSMTPPLPAPSIPLPPSLPPTPAEKPVSKKDLTMPALPPLPVENAAPPAPALPPLSNLDQVPQEKAAGANPKSNAPLPSLSALNEDSNEAAKKAAASKLPPPLPPLPTEKENAALPTLPPLVGTSKSSTSATAAPTTPVGETQMASLPTPAELPATAAAGSAATPDPDVRITFAETETDVPLAQTAPLDKLAKMLTANPNERVNIIAYASGPETSGVFPKRVSLARGIAIRNYLTTTKGIDIERVNVKAQGNKSTSGPGDRVDIFVLK